MRFKEIEDTGYFIFENGMVLNKKGNAIKHSLSRIGYPIVCIRKNKKPKIYSIHRLIALSFIPNLYNKPNVNHIDRDKLNFDLSNLEWCTQKENVNHSINLGSYRNSKKRCFSILHNDTKFSEVDIECIRFLNIKGYGYNSISKMFPISLTHFSNVTNNLRRVKNG